jgi:type I restriction enzyme S subunit
MSYKTLGDYIQPVNIRNKDLEVTTLLGVSIRKVLMPSIANTIGTNMKTYKIIKQNQFAYGPVTSRNGDKISIALLEEHETAIVSQAYTVFEVIDEQEVLPEYLMMWFRRPDFDRFARFKSHGSAREVFDWEELCDTQLPIPSIEKQQQIVAEYNTVTNRINLNNQLNQNLEETAQALYKHWFVDFEFPYDFAQGKPNAENKPYKSSGGLMVYNEELDKDIPVGWEPLNCDDLSLISAGGDKPIFFSKNLTKSNQVPIYSNSTFNQGLFGYTNKAKVFDDSITISARGGIGHTELRTTEYFPIVRLIVVIPNEPILLNYLYHFLSKYSYNDISSAQAQLTIPDVSNFKIPKPSNEDLQNFQNYTKEIYSKIELKMDETKKLQELQSLLLAKMTQQETKLQAV